MKAIIRLIKVHPGFQKPSGFWSPQVLHCVGWDCVCVPAKRVNTITELIPLAAALVGAFTERQAAISERRLRERSTITAQRKQAESTVADAASLLFILESLSVLKEDTGAHFQVGHCDDKFHRAIPVLQSWLMLCYKRGSCDAWMVFVQATGSISPPLL